MLWTMFIGASVMYTGFVTMQYGTTIPPFSTIPFTSPILIVSVISSIAAIFGAGMLTRLPMNEKNRFTLLLALYEVPVAMGVVTAFTLEQSVYSWIASGLSIALLLRAKPNTTL